MAILDLHGIRHEEVERVMNSFINSNFYKNMKIITGRSQTMRSLVCTIIECYDLEYQIGDLANDGYIMIYNYSEEK